MVMVNIKGKMVGMDGYLYENLEALKKLVDKKWDGIGYVFGYEGDGKSTIASQIVSYLDPTIDMDRVVFTGEQFLKAVNDAKPKQAILFDEAYLTFTNKGMWDSINRIIIAKLTMIRKKQLYIMIVSPTFFDLNKYLVIHRSRFMIRAYTKEDERGYFAFYNRDRKHQLYIKGKKDEDVKRVPPNFWGSFSKHFPFNEEEYEAKKDQATEQLIDVLDKNTKQSKDKTLLKGLVYMVKVDLKMPTSQIVQRLPQLTQENISKTTINRYINEIEGGVLGIPNTNPQHNIT